MGKEPNRWEPFSNREIEILRDSVGMGICQPPMMGEHAAEDIWEQLCGEVDRRWDESLKEEAKGQED